MTGNHSGHYPWTKATVSHRLTLAEKEQAQLWMKYKTPMGSVRAVLDHQVQGRIAPSSLRDLKPDNCKPEAISQLAASGAIAMISLIEETNTTNTVEVKYVHEQGGLLPPTGFSNFLGQHNVFPGTKRPLTGPLLALLRKTSQALSDSLLVEFLSFEDQLVKLVQDSSGLPGGGELLASLDTFLTNLARHRGSF